jgi:hypothetical protein
MTTLTLEVLKQLSRQLYKNAKTVAHIDIITRAHIYHTLVQKLNSPALFFLWMDYIPFNTEYR